MHVFKERYVKKCGKDICGSKLYTLVVSFFPNKVPGYPNFQQLSRVVLTELNLNFLICVSRHLYKHIGKKKFGKELVPRFARYLIIFPD
jgi:hypothetical protein